MKERILELQRDGLTFRAIADRLNEEGVPTIKGQPWNQASVARAAAEEGLTTKPTPQEMLKKDPTNKLALADLDDRARYFASGNLDIWAIRHINEEYSK